MPNYSEECYTKPNSSVGEEVTMNRKVLDLEVIAVLWVLCSLMGQMWLWSEHCFQCFFSCLQVSRLEQTWTVLRQRHTEGAILYEKTLKPFMKSLNDGKGINLYYIRTWAMGSFPSDAWNGMKNGLFHHCSPNVFWRLFMIVSLVQKQLAAGGLF